MLHLYIHILWVSFERFYLQDGHLTKLINFTKRMHRFIFLPLSELEDIAAIETISQLNWNTKGPVLGYLTKQVYPIEWMCIVRAAADNI